MVAHSLEEETGGKNHHPLKKTGGRYLTFVIANEVYGFEITRIQEIIQMQKVTRVPQVKDYIRGIINLRGKIIPVIELRRRFSLPSREDTEKTCIIVAQVQGEQNAYPVGIIIDEIKEVLDIAAENTEPPSMFGKTEYNEFISGISRINDEVKILLDVDKIITAA